MFDPKDGALRPEEEAYHTEPSTPAADKSAVTHDATEKLFGCARNPNDAIAIVIARLVLLGQLHHDHAYFEEAHEAAGKAFELTVAVQIVTRVTWLIRAIRLERVGNFYFLAPNCSRITPDEKTLLIALQAAINSDSVAFNTALIFLTRGSTFSRTAQALSLLAETLKDTLLAQPVIRGRLH